jgi:hypothetical protein
MNKEKNEAAVNEEFEIAGALKKKIIVIQNAYLKFEIV